MGRGLDHDLVAQTPREIKLMLSKTVYHNEISLPVNI